MERKAFKSLKKGANQVEQQKKKKRLLDDSSDEEDNVFNGMKL